MSRVKLQTLLDRSIRNMGKVHQVVKDTTIEVIKRAYNEGINVQISSGYRSHAEQNRLYAQGRTTGGNIVTNARGGQSYHNFGLAVDYFLTSEDGNTATWVVNYKWRRVAQIAKSLGFEWGGDWNSFVDYPHLQMAGGLSLAQLRAGQRPNLTSKVSNSTPTPSTPKKSSTKWTDKKGEWTGGVLQLNDKGQQVKELQELLASKHFYPEKGAKNNGVDSYFGANTKNAVERYQTMNNLQVDGIAGKETYNTLKGKNTYSKVSKPKYDLPNETYWVKNPPADRFNGKGVKTVQKALASIHFYPNKGAKNNGIDGWYGPDTADAVKRFQSVHGLKQDGDYGPATRKVLDREVN